MIPLEPWRDKIDNLRASLYVDLFDDMVDPFIKEEVIEVDHLEKQIMEVIEVDHGKETNSGGH